MAAFDEVRLPVEVERGAVGGPGFLTTIIPLNSGKEQRNQQWEVDRGEWDIGYGINERAEILAIRDFFYARRGMARGFRFRDWTNYQALTEQPAGDDYADGVGSTFACYYVYADTGDFSYRKRIFKPVASGFKVFVDGVESAGANWTLNTATGNIAFTAPPAYGSDITWTGTFDLPVRFDTDRLELSVETKQAITIPPVRIVELKL